MRAEHGLSATFVKTLELQNTAVELGCGRATMAGHHGVLRVTVHGRRGDMGLAAPEPQGKPGACLRCRMASDGMAGAGGSGRVS